MFKIIAALFFRRTGVFLRLRAQRKGAAQFAEHLFERQSDRQKIKPRAAAHGPEIDDILLMRTVPKERGNDMLYGMQRFGRNVVAAVGRFHAQVESGNALLYGGKVQPRLQIVVIFTKGRDFFHHFTSLNICGTAAVKAPSARARLSLYCCTQSPPTTSEIALYI